MTQTAKYAPPLRSFTTYLSLFKHSIPSPLPSLVTFHINHGCCPWSIYPIPPLPFPEGSEWNGSQYPQTSHGIPTPCKFHPCQSIQKKKKTHPFPSQPSNLSIRHHHHQAMSHRSSRHLTRFTAMTTYRGCVPDS